MNYAVLIELLSASIRIATPLLLVALGGVISELAGTFAVGVEGMMLMGAFGGAVTALVAKNLVVELIASWVFAVLLAIIIAVATVKFRADQMVTGLAANIFALGFTSFLLRALFGGKAPVMVLPTIGAMHIPWLSQLPIAGPILFDEPLMTYLAFLLVIPVHWFLRHTQAGLTLRAVGENPEAAFSVGANPHRIRMMAILACGVFAGLGGATLSLQELGTFTDGMTNGRGFLALAAIIVGRWMPFRLMWGSLLIGAA